METLHLRDGETLSLRPATSADGPEVMALIFEVLAEYGLGGEAAGTDACVQDIAGNYWRSGGAFTVVEDGQGQLVGCYGLQAHAPGVCELRKMYLRRQVRGRGLGKQLLERALAEARRLGFRRVELDTAAALVEAVALYRRFGFQDFAKTDIPARCDRAMALDL